ncbi:uncharacterized protein LOC118143664 [Callithrix jacchus]
MLKNNYNPGHKVKRQTDWRCQKLWNDTVAAAKGDRGEQQPIRMTVRDYPASTLWQTPSALYEFISSHHKSVSAFLHFRHGALNNLTWRQDCDTENRPPWRRSVNALSLLSDRGN